MALGRGFETTPLALDGDFVRHRFQQLRVGARRAHRTSVLALSTRSAFQPHVRSVGACQSWLRHSRRSVVHGDARRAPARVRLANRNGVMGRRSLPTIASATPPRWRRSSSRTRSLSAFRAATIPRAVSSTRTSRKPASGSGASTRFPQPASLAARRGPALTSSRAGGGGTWVTGSYDPELEPPLLGNRQSES